MSSSGSSITFIIEPGGRLDGSIRVPGDKSISHRSVMLGALSNGLTQVEGFLEGEDSLATLNAFRAMGVRIDGPNNGELIINGVGLHGLQAPSGPLDLGNSGTSMRLMSGILSGQHFDSVLIGDESLTKRPMSRVANPLREMGAVIDTAEAGRSPLRIQASAGSLKGIRYELPVASAQIKSCLLLAGLFAEGETSVIEPAPTRDHTERMLKTLGYEVVVDGPRITVSGGGELEGGDIKVPADISSAAFFMVAASIIPGSDIVLNNVGVNPTRTGIVHILKEMGADIEVFNQRDWGAEPVADIRVRGTQLRGIEIPEQYVPLAIDEFPALFIAAACASGQTVLTGAEELRVKESDRIAVMAEGLIALGVNAEPTVDGMVIEGGAINGGVVNSHGDHRIAMAFAVAGAVAESVITIHDCNNVATSFPNFLELAKQSGLNISSSQDQP